MNGFLAWCTRVNLRSMEWGLLIICWYIKFACRDFAKQLPDRVLMFSHWWCLHWALRSRQKNFFSKTQHGAKRLMKTSKRKTKPVRSPPVPTQSSRPKPDAQKGRDHHHRGRSQDTRYHSKASGMSLIRQVGVLWLFWRVQIRRRTREKDSMKYCRVD